MKQINIVISYLRKIKNPFTKYRCSHCRSSKVSSGYFTRGYNNLCKQATGDRGLWCYRCLKVTWFQDIEKYRAKLPSWCTAYKN